MKTFKQFVEDMDMPPPEPFPQIEYKSIFEQEAKDIDVLASLLILEAGGEVNTHKAMVAVMNVIENRANRDPSKFADEALKKWQFSAFNSHTVKGKPLQPLLDHARNHEDYPVAVRIVERAMKGELPDVTIGADHYHNNKVNPSWNKKMTHTVTIDNHIFYRSR